MMEASVPFTNDAELKSNTFCSSVKKCLPIIWSERGDQAVLYTATNG